MLFQLFLFNLFGYVGNVMELSIVEESNILIIYFLFVGFIFDFVIPFCLKNKIKWYSLEDSKNVKINYNTIIRNSIIILMFHVLSSYFIFYTSEPWSVNICIYNNALLFPMNILTRILFFCSHTHLHFKPLKRIHNIHHEYSFPTAFAGLHAHWFETIYSNLLPLYLPMILCNIDRYYRLGYLISSMTYTFISHLSYRPCNKKIAKFLGFSRYHFIHHQEPKYNRGLSNGFLDKLYGTYKSPLS